MAARSTSKSKTTATDSKVDAATDAVSKSAGSVTNKEAGDKSAELDARQTELEKREAAIIEKEAELTSRSEALDAREAELEAQNTPTASTTISSGETERHRFKVLKPCRFKGKRRSVDEEVELTEEEYEDLAAIGAVVEDQTEDVSDTGKVFGFLQTSN